MLSKFLLAPILNHLTGSFVDRLQGIQSTQIDSTSDVYGKGRPTVVL